MTEPYVQKLFLGLIHSHILHHAAREPFYGLWMIEELSSHGYAVSPGTLYPLLHKMTADGLLEVHPRVVDTRVRKYYTVTSRGREVLDACRVQIREACRELCEGANAHD